MRGVALKVGTYDELIPQADLGALMKLQLPRAHRTPWWG